MLWQPTWITLLLSVGFIVLMYQRFGTRDPLVAIFSFYLFFTYGPVLNYLLGNQIYFGTVREQIFKATIIFTIAIGTVFIVSHLVKPKLNFPNITTNLLITRSPVLGFVLIVLIAYTAYVLLNSYSAVSGLTKTQRLAIASSFHYKYLLLQMAIMSLYFQINKSSITLVLYYINSILYISYCLIFTERDFIFMIFSILLHINLLSSTTTHRRKTFHYILLVPVLIFISSILAQFRRGIIFDGGFFTRIFNEGSILLIVTSILEWTDKGIVGFSYGKTYLNSFLNLLPGALIDQTDKLFFLTKWFSSIYAPRGTSNYGFSLDAETYLNFGYWGIPITFALFTLLQRWSFNRIGTHPFYLYFSVFFVGFSMYSLRNDSLALISGCFYAILFFFTIYLLSKITVTLHYPQIRFKPVMTDNVSVDI